MLALMSGVDRSYVERGENNAAVLTLIKICVALDISLETLAKKSAL